MMRMRRILPLRLVMMMLVMILELCPTKAFEWKAHFPLHHSHPGYYDRDSGIGGSRTSMARPTGRAGLLPPTSPPPTLGAAKLTTYSSRSRLRLTTFSAMNDQAASGVQNFLTSITTMTPLPPSLASLLDPESVGGASVIVAAIIGLVGWLGMIVWESSIRFRPLLDRSTLQTILQGTYLEKRASTNSGRLSSSSSMKKEEGQEEDRIACVYKASVDGWSALRFHQAVDQRGAGLVVARVRTSEGRLATVGGYNPAGWRSSDDYYTSTTAFLYYLVAPSQSNAWNKQSSEPGHGLRVIKLPVLPGGNAAIFDWATAGPCFGSCDFWIGPPRAAVLGGFAGPDAEDMSTSAGNLRQGQSMVGITYRETTTSTKIKNEWPARGNFWLLDLEVYCDAQWS